MPLLDNMLFSCDIEREELRAIAVSAGPGSFTGLRIGLATARALAQGLSIPAVSVGTLEALAEAVPCAGSWICPLLDARRNQVYTALYRRPSDDPQTLESVIEPAAMTVDELVSKLINITKEQIVFIGEGLHTYSQILVSGLPSGQACITPAPYRLCRASYVALRGQALMSQNFYTSYDKLVPIYLRQPEAERLAAERQGGKKR